MLRAAASEERRAVQLWSLAELDLARARCPVGVDGTANLLADSSDRGTEESSLGSLTRESLHSVEMVVRLPPKAASHPADYVRHTAARAVCHGQPCRTDGLIAAVSMDDPLAAVGEAGVIELTVGFAAMTGKWAGTAAGARTGLSVVSVGGEAGNLLQTAETAERLFRSELAAVLEAGFFSANDAPLA